MDHALEPWLEDLRRRMVDITGRRVPADDAEDLVQNAMRVIVEKGGALGAGDEIDGRPRIGWCLQVLRNVIGNYYRRSETRKKMIAGSIEPERLGSLLESQSSQERIKMIEDGLAELTAADSNCGRYLTRMADEIPAREIARDEGIEPHALYQRLYRCRAKLREILRRKGVLP
jgi:RNA polymerase sigma factor (sigma-70 family)